MAKLWQFLQGYPKPAFSVKVQRGDQAKFFKNRPKSSPRLKGPKAHWRKWHYPLICTNFKVQTLENILAQTAAPKVPEWPSYGNFREVIENPHFLKECKGGTRGNFFKNRSKSKPRLKGRKALLRKGYYPLIIMHLRAKTGDDFRAKRL